MKKSIFSIVMLLSLSVAVDSIARCSSCNGGCPVATTERVASDDGNDDSDGDEEVGDVEVDVEEPGEGRVQVSVESED